MASKNVYFFGVDLYHQEELIEYRKIKDIIIKIVDKHAIEFSGYKTLDVTPFAEDMHIILDVYDYKNNSFFVRMSRQKPSNSLVQHDYRTYKKEDVLPGNKEHERGVEQYTYGLLKYETGIFMLVSTMGAPNEKVIHNLLTLYAHEYAVEMIPVPNEKAIESIYEKEDAEITRLEIEVPLPEAGVLENLFHWKEREILDVFGERKLATSVVIKPLQRGKSITDNQVDTQRIMNIIKRYLPEYNKAKMRAKARNFKLREYNFFEDKFSYPMEISAYHTRDGEKIYYSVEELAEIYRRNMRLAYNESEGLLKIILGR